MHILFVCPELRDRGGNFLVSELAHRLPKYGWKVTVATLVAEGDPVIRSGSESLWKNISILPINIPAEKGTLAYVSESILCTNKFLQNFKADIYVADGGLPPLGLRISNQQPALIFNQGLQDCTKIDEQLPNHDEQSIRTIDKILRSIGLLTNIPIVTVSNPHKEKLNNLYGKLNINVIEPGIATPFFNVMKENFKLSSPVIVATSGANLVDKGKGFGFLCQSLNLLFQSGVNFILRIHSTEFKPDMFDMRFPFELVPAASPDHLARELCKADIYVNASVYETFCLSIAEALAVGLPSVVTNSTGPKTYLNGDNNICVEERSPAVFSLAIKRLLEMNEEKRTNMGQSARKTMSVYTLENMVHKWDMLLRKVVQK